MNTIIIIFVYKKRKPHKKVDVLKQKATGESKVDQVQSWTSHGMHNDEFNS